MTIQLTPANTFSLQELTSFYNQTRVDYMVPMPMNKDHMQEYIHLYDVDLGQSLVAFDAEDNSLLGLGMLGVRKGRSWVTRLGIVPNQRRKGAGRAVFEGLLRNSERLKLPITQLEVIVGNQPAHRLFVQFDFREQRELLILRRPPRPLPPPGTLAQDVGYRTVMQLLGTKNGPASWVNQHESFEKVKEMQGLVMQEQGWIVFRPSSANLTRITFHAGAANDPALVRELFLHLHACFPDMEAYIENIHTDNAHLETLYDLGYMEDFRRVEMVRQASTG